MKPDWQTSDGSVKLFLGDCLSVLPHVGAVDAVVTDPPYGIDYQSAWRTDRTQWKPKIANDERPFVWFLPGAFNAATNPACLLCFCRWDVQEAFQKAIEWAGWECKSQVIWDREAHGMGDLNGCPAPQHDVLWFATKGNYKFHGDRPKSVVRSMRLGGDELIHPNQKPVDLMEQLVVSYAPKGATVLDCFLGSGSTGIACMRTERRFVGIESDPGIFWRTVERFDAELDRERLFEPAPAIQRSLLGDHP
jgi:DNA modification methylase